MHRAVLRKWGLIGGLLAGVVLLAVGTKSPGKGHPVTQGEVKVCPWGPAVAGRPLVLHDLRSEHLMGLNRTVELPGEGGLLPGGWSDAGGFSAGAASPGFLSAQPNLPTDSRRGLLDGLDDAPVDGAPESWGWLESDVRAGSPELPVERSDGFLPNRGYGREDRAGGGSANDEMFLFQRRREDSF